MQHEFLLFVLPTPAECAFAGSAREQEKEDRADSECDQGSGGKTRPGGDVQPAQEPDADEPARRSIEDRIGDQRQIKFFHGLIFAMDFSD